MLSEIGTNELCLQRQNMALETELRLLKEDLARAREGVLYVVQTLATTTYEPLTREVQDLRARLDQLTAENAHLRTQLDSRVPEHASIKDATSVGAQNHSRDVVAKEHDAVKQISTEAAPEEQFRTSPTANKVKNIDACIDLHSPPDEVELALIEASRLRRQVRDHEHRNLAGQATFIESMDSDEETRRFWTKQSRSNPSLSPEGWRKYYDVVIRPDFLQSMQSSQAQEGDATAGCEQHVDNGEFSLLGENGDYNIVARSLITGEPEPTSLLDADEDDLHRHARLSLPIQQSKDETPPQDGNRRDKLSRSAQPAEIDLEQSEPESQRVEHFHYNSQEVRPARRRDQHSSRRSDGRRVLISAVESNPAYPMHQSDTAQCHTVILSGLPYETQLVDVLKHVANGAVLQVSFCKTAIMRTNPPMRGDSAMLVFQESTSAEAYVQYRRTKPLLFQHERPLLPGQDEGTSTIAVQLAPTTTNPGWFNKLPYQHMHPARRRKLTRVLHIHYEGDCENIKMAEELVSLIHFAAEYAAKQGMCPMIGSCLSFEDFDENAVRLEFAGIFDAMQAKSILEKEQVTADNGVKVFYGLDSCLRSFDDLPVVAE